MTPPPAPLQALLQAGLAAQQRGDAEAAAGLYRQVLAAAPEQADALQLLGLLARQRGDDAEAESLWRRSLQARPQQPHVLNNLANLLARHARVDEALPLLRQALALAPRYADARYNLARLLHGQGHAEAASAELALALSSGEGPRAAMLQLAAQIDGDAGRLDAALAALDQALAIAPDRGALHHNRAVLLQRLQRPAEALQAHQRAQALGVDAADAHYNHGNTLQSLGRLREALAAYAAALRVQPDHALALYDGARLRWRLGAADFDAALREAIAAHPGSSELPLLLGQLLWRAERWHDAAAAYALAARRAPEAGRAQAQALDGQGRCRVRLGEVDAGLADQARAVALAPDDLELRLNHATSLLIARRHRDAEREAAAALALAPLDQRAWALRALAWRCGGDPRHPALEDLDTLVRVVDLPPPAGWSDMAAFNAALAAELDALHGDREAPIDQTLRGGTQTFGSLFDQGHPLVDALKARIAEAVETHLAALPADPAHPVLSRRAARWRFTDSWSSRLRPQGFHTDHVHPHGWYSSVYYVQVPPVVADQARHQGWLQLGRPDFDCGLADPVRRLVQPRVGRLVLFPSMLWHGTTPFDDAAPRMTIAFDIVPD